ncbi:glycoside hydrolase family 19 protein [Agrobacterium tumefaciens]|uniref:glycoside hydrolase family 19 protein n=1 Tax=Agrobacterium tumefaciens TaxID=358 RepID=UPI001572F767|nr:glycoside hydrolase family 19 protein [Agrobacterium tumefaciens]WHO24251.1 glycoside hydrolase family 19 protein [Agrobacterium tumefaciens]
MDATTFFAYARRAPFGGRLTQGQIDGMNALFRCWDSHKIPAPDKRHLAYILASVFHETGGRMVPVRETFASTDAGAIAALDKAYNAGRLGQVSKPYWRKGANGKAYFGRGDIQLTHEENYKVLGERIDVDLVGNPSLALDLDISAEIAIVGMLEGLFTGKKLTDYFNLKKDDPVGARAVVNGRDKAKLIAGYYKSFLDALEAATLAYYQGQPDDVAERDAQPDNVRAMKSKSLLTIIGSFLGAIGLGAVDDLKGVVESGATLFGAISNPWAFGSLVFATTGAVVLTWLVGSGRITINRSAAP